MLDFVNAMPVIEHRGRAALADDPLLVLVFAGHGIALIVTTAVEKPGPVGATADAGALEVQMPPFHQVSGGPARGRRPARLQREARGCMGDR